VPGRYRWWDGAHWTQAIGESPKAPPPDALAARLARGELIDDDTDSGLPAELDDPDEIELGPRRASPVRMVLAIALSITLVVTAGLGAGLVIWRDTGPPSSTQEPQHSRAPTTKTSPGAPPTGQLDPKDGTATLGPASITLPGSPYRLYADPITVPYLFQICFLANAEVHERYDGTKTWSANVALAQISPELINTSDLEKTAAKAAERYAQRFFGGHDTRLGRLSVSDWSVDGHPGVMINFRVSYQVKDLASKYDKVSVILVRLDDGSFIAATSSVPNDADPELAELARESLESLRIKE
jgi:hypothetical protein